MATRDYAANEAELPSGTLVELFLEATERFGDEPAFRYWTKDGWREVSYRDVRERAVAVAAALGTLGLDRGDRVALLSENRVEWAITDYGALLAGVQIVPIYATLTSSEIQYLLTDSGARIVFVSDGEQLSKVLEIRDACPALERVVVFDTVGDLPRGVLPWEGFVDRGRTALEKTSPDEIERRAKDADPGDVATVLYTSGTTGPPKGVMLTHQNVFSNVAASRRVLPLGPGDRTLSILPLSHILQRMVDYLFFRQGCMIAYPRSLDTVRDDMQTVAPTVMVAIPRVYEKIHGRVMEASGFRGRLVDWACGVGEAWARETLAGRTPGLLLRLRYAVADRLVFRKVREGVGGAIRYFVSGGGALSPDINRFFYYAGLPILEGYGLTETSPVTNVNTVEDFRIGTVGKPVPGTEIRIGDEGEILVRGPQVMKGYFKRPEETEKTITEDGWLHTGDIGEIDEDGFLTVTDRLKDLIITSGGKNIAPQPIENLLKRNRYVEEAVMVGDGRKFASVLVVPAFGSLEARATERGIDVRDRHRLLKDPEVQSLLEEEIYGELRDLARYKRPKKVGLLPEGFTVEGGVLTPSGKVKRRVVEERYRELIDTFYTEEAVETTMFVAEPDRRSEPEAA